MINDKQDQRQARPPPPGPSIWTLASQRQSPNYRKWVQPCFRIVRGGGGGGRQRRRRQSLLIYRFSYGIEWIRYVEINVFNKLQLRSRYTSPAQVVSLPPSPFTRGRDREEGIHSAADFRSKVFVRGFVTPAGVSVLRVALLALAQEIFAFSPGIDIITIFVWPISWSFIGP